MCAKFGDNRSPGSNILERWYASIYYLVFLPITLNSIFIQEMCVKGD